MRKTGMKSQILIGLAVTLALGCAQAVSAEPAEQTFTSADAAVQALFVAVQSNNEDAIMQVLGGGKEIISSESDLDDTHDRNVFVEKYQQMHRIAPEGDGTSSLYIGAENWPFPIPLVTSKGHWYFDADAGAQELLFRQVGEDESMAVRTCRVLSQTGTQKDASQGAAADDAVVQFVRNLMSAKDASGNGAKENPSSTTFHGYSFRRIERGANDAAKNTVFLAYPTEYRSTGVMTFAVTPGGAVYEKDLGAKTTTLASKMGHWRHDSSWRPAETDIFESASR